MLSIYDGMIVVVALRPAAWIEQTLSADWAHRFNDEPGRYVVLLHRNGPWPIQRLTAYGEDA